MTPPKTRPLSIRFYFVDEAGDGTLFDRRGRVLVGTEGCSRYFILGLLDVRQLDPLAQEIEALRAQLLADPYFRKVPSMQPEAKKTELAFHAKDNVPEVRREVFHLLLQHDLRYFAVVWDKGKVIEYVRQRNQQESSYRYNPNELYDYLVRPLFKNLLHKDEEYHICFSRRGKADGTFALRQALEAARQRFGARWGIASNAPINVVAGAPPASAGLQAADHCLWALQRLYEHREERYVQ